MNKRLLSAGLWLYAGWTLGAMVALALGLDSILGPILAIAAATLFVVDPRRMIWTQRDAGREVGEAWPGSV